MTLATTSPSIGRGRMATQHRDEPNAAGRGRTSPNAATQFSHAQPTAGPCSGDSGGPAFLQRDGVPYVAGVTSFGDAYCQIYGVSTRTDAFGQWIDAYVNVPVCGADGWCNPECGADPDCQATACGDGVCDAGESCDGRDGTAACSADCPGKTGGKPTGRYCYVGGLCVGPGCN